MSDNNINNLIGGILLAAPKSGSGKTMVSCGLMKCLKNIGKNVVAYKCGPDYIDPMYHKKIIGVPSYNLDSFFLDENNLNSFYESKYLNGNGEIAIVEGVMGLYDGLGGISREGSAYHVASIIKTPIILVVDVKGMGGSVVPLISGFLNYDNHKLIKGVILNRATKTYYESVKELIERELSIKALGFVPNDNKLSLESRHLGLKLPEEISDLQDNIEYAAEIIKTNIDVDGILDIVNESKRELIDRKTKEKQCELANGQLKPKVKLAVAMDEAFCFYYEHNFDVLKKYGVELVSFSPLHDECIPKGVSGILLGGGYPELYAKSLSQNKSMLASVKASIENGMPSIAECGGFMYLHNSISDKDGKSYDMVGAIDGHIDYKGKLVRFGYINVNEKKSIFLEDGIIKGHEFHYYDSSNNGDNCTATKPLTGKNWDCIHATEKSWWGFPHLYYASNEKYVEKFVQKMIEYKNVEKIDM